MPEAPAQMPALAPALPFQPLRAPGGALTLAALPQGRLIHVLARAGESEADCRQRLAALSDAGPQAVRPYAPDQWFVTGTTPLAPGELARQAQALGPALALCDQSHGRVRLSLEGPKARDVLAAGIGIDLCETEFGPGRSATTLFGPIGVHLTCLDRERFELIVLRGFAESLWHELAHAAGLSGDQPGVPPPPAL